jgi:hypothetical protein
VLAQRDEIAFVQLVCFACQVQTLALVTGLESIAHDTGGEEADGGVGEPEAAVEGVEAAARPDGKRPRRERRPISEDDVLEMRSFLAGYEGDIHGLLDRSDDPSKKERRDRGSRGEDGPRDGGPDGGQTGDRSR